MLKDAMISIISRIIHIIFIKHDEKYTVNWDASPVTSFLSCLFGGRLLSKKWEEYIINAKYVNKN